MPESTYPRIFVIIAAYNEQPVIGSTVEGVLAVTKDVVVVDDASIDETARGALEAGAHVLRHPINLGQGAALQTGIEYAIISGADIIVTFDADGQHNASEILGMCNLLETSQVDIVLGSRFLKAGGTIGLTGARKFLLELAVLFTKLTSGLNLSDAHNGFRAFTVRFARNFSFKQNRMAHASEILNYISRNDIRYMEYPVTITYTSRSIAKGQKGINALRIILELILGKISK